MAAIGGADHGRDARRQLLDVVREERDAGRAGLLDRRALVVAADREVDHAGDGLAARADAETRFRIAAPPALCAAETRCARGGRERARDQPAAATRTVREILMIVAYPNADAGRHFSWR